VAVLGPARAGAVEPHDARADGKDDPWTLCARHAAEIESRENLPPHLLTAISKVESGRWRAAEKTVHAWPWTVTWDGKGRFFASKAEALETVRALRAGGRRSIDVGCMQVNLYYHPEAFEDLRAALDPARNIAYAADLLKRLEKEARSWPKAVAYYHSRKARFNDPYRRKEFRAWHEEWLQASLAPPADTANLASRLATRAALNSGGPKASGLGQVQLGAFRDAENAHSVWFKLRQENAALLGDLTPRIDVIDRGQSGALHLLRLNPVMTLKHARSICSKLLDRAVDCFVVEPPRRLALDGAVQRFR
jgi:hypothetical protein